MLKICLLSYRYRNILTMFASSSPCFSSCSSSISEGSQMMYSRNSSLTFSSIESYLQALLSVKIKKNRIALKYADGAVHCRSHWSSTWLTLLRLSEEVFIVKTLFRWFLSYPNMRVSYAVVSISIPSYRLSCTREG